MLAAIACGGRGSSDATVNPDTAQKPVAANADAAPKKAEKPTNPGGMWMPSQIPAQAEQLRAMGYEGDPKLLSDPTQFPLNAVVSLGGCSASFVSPEGLVVTNHHCSTGMLQYNSKPDENLLRDGFVARARGEERWAGPSAHIYVTTKLEDVSAQVLGAGASVNDPVARLDAMEAKEKELTKTCNDESAGKRCYISSFYEGSTFIRIEQDVISDVRLVYAPHDGIGVFGGEIDNWRWPRHTGDYTFLRAYVGPDGKPAKYSPQNVPYRPKAHLKIATGDLDAGDFAMVAGYPGRTSRIRTADEVDDAMRWYFPTRIQRFEETLALLHQLAATDPELAIKLNGRIRGYGNALTNNKGMLDGLSKDGLARRKADEEAKLRAFIAADPKRYEKYHDVLVRIAAVNAQTRETREQEMAEMVIGYASSYLGVADILLEAGAERDEAKGKLDDTKLKGYEERLERSLHYADPRIDKALVTLALKQAARLPKDQQPASLQIIAGDARDDAGIQAAVDKLFEKTTLTDLERAKKELARASKKKLERSKDPLVKWAVEREAARDPKAKERARALEAEMAELRPRFVEVLRAFKGDTPIAPDANSTLRITYGTVRGYSPAPGKPVYTPFTTLPEMVAKHTGEEPFAAPDRILAAAKRGDLGNYADPELSTLPVNFLADLDITGGNSGSATLNAKGELIGLVFDGNYEAMASDWIFMPSITRSIHVDIRYILWVMDAVDHVDHLLLEMGLQPQISAPQAAR